MTIAMAMENVHNKELAVHPTSSMTRYSAISPAFLCEFLRHALNDQPRPVSAPRSTKEHLAHAVQIAIVLW